MMPSKPDKISDLGEKKLIKRILKKSQNPRIKSLFLNETSIKSFSDDAALIDLGKEFLVTTSDMLMESAHFPHDMTKYQIGQKIVTVNVSDVAAMGAEPIGILISMGLPRDMLIEDFDELVDGILDACKKYDMYLLGGDTNESLEFTLCGTCIGMVKKENALLKSGAVAGDVVAVTGPLGLAAAGFQTLLNPNIDLDDIKKDTKYLVLKHALEPEAKLKTGILLAESGAVTSATDITDGLLSELGEMVEANDHCIGVVIDQEHLPIPPEVFEIANTTNADPYEMALTYGEDFELLITIDRVRFKDLKSQDGIYEIGYVDSSGKIKMIDKAGKTNIITPRGYEHLK